MEHETLFTATKWDILKQLEHGPQSPLELTKKLQSSLANVSQQLRLLEMAGLVTSKRISNRDKDKPRILYTLTGNLSYLIATTNNFVDKKILSLSDRNKVILKIWFLEDPAVRYALEKTFWTIEQHLEKIEKIAYAGIKNGAPVLEFSGAAHLPANVELTGQFSNVKLVHSATPSGYVLFEQYSVPRAERRV